MDILVRTIHQYKSSTILSKYTVLLQASALDSNKNILFLREEK